MKAKENFWEELNEIKSMMVRMGEKLPSYDNGSSFYKKIEETKLPFILNEGLISSYPTERVISSISNIFDLKTSEMTNYLSLRDKVNGKSSHSYNGEIYKINDANTDAEKIKLILYNNDLLDDINFYFKKYGWDCAEIGDDVYIYEKKFDTSVLVKQLINFGADYLYHITTKNLEEKILKQGLIPKNKGNNGFNDSLERTYLFLNEPTDDKLMDFYAYKFSQPVILLKIDLLKLNQWAKLYFDPRMDDALYTYEPIPYNAISIINEYNANEN